MDDRIAVVIPTYNEKASITVLIKRISEILPRVRVFVVDDNSPDGTAQEVQKLAYADDRIRLILRSAKEGLASAYLDAFARIIPDDSIHYIVTMDADLSHDPGDLRFFLPHLEGGHDLVIGSRYVPGGKIENWDLRRRLLSNYANKYAKLITGLPVEDLTAGFVAYSREILGNILANIVMSEGYAFQIEMKYLAHKQRAKIKEVPITFRERASGTSKLSNGVIWEGIKMPWYLRFYK